MLLPQSAGWSRRPTRASIANPAATARGPPMTNSRPLLVILAAVLAGGVAHASQFSLGSAHLLAESSAQSSVDVTMNFTDRGRALRETAEGGDTTPQHNTNTLRGADVATPDTSSDSHAATPATPTPKSTEPAPATT